MHRLYKNNGNAGVEYNGKAKKNYVEKFNNENTYFILSYK